MMTQMQLLKKQAEMLTYEELLAQFKQDLKGAIAIYQQHYERAKKPIPLHRSQNIVELTQAIDNEMQTDESLKKEMQAIMDRFKTGLRLFGYWIFETGHSTLKVEILHVVNLPCYSENSFLHARINAFSLEDKSNTAEESEPKNQEQDLQENRQEILFLEQENKNLVREKRRVERLNQNFSVTNRSLRLENKKLKKELKEKKNQSTLEDTQKEENVSSPSHTMKNTFGLFD